MQLSEFGLGAALQYHLLFQKVLNCLCLCTIDQSVHVCAHTHSTYSTRVQYAYLVRVAQFFEDLDCVLTNFRLLKAP